MKSKYLLIITIFLFASAFYFFFIAKSKTDNVPKQKSLSGAMQALDFWNTQRAYPNKDIPDEIYYKAFEYSKSLPLLKATEDSNDTWKPMGPHNIGGRTISIAINPKNPNTIFAGAASGGLWRSYTAGVGANVWHQIKLGFPALGIGSIAINPQDTNTIYIGTGEVYGYQNSIGGVSIRTTRGSYGIGILKTTNYGVSWTKILDWSYNQRRGVQVVKLNPQNPNIIFAGTSEGIFKSFDAGKNWTQVHNILMTTDIIINPIDTNLVLAASGNLASTGTGIYKSTDAGTTWTKITSGLPASWGGKVLLMYYKTNPNIVFASIGNGSSSGTYLCKSTDFGSTWNQVSTNDYSTYQGWYSHFVIVNDVDSSKLLFGGVDMWKSTNGGTTQSRKSDWAAWYFGVVPPGGPEGPTNYSHADHHAYTVHPTNPNIVYLANDGGVFVTTDFGETFSGRNGGYQTQQFYKRFGSSTKDTTRAIGGLQDNATCIWEGTVAWRRVLGGDGACCAINPNNTDTMYGSSQYLAMSRSTNKGLNWSGIAPSSNLECFVGPYALAPSNPKIIYAGADKLFKSTTGGGNWVAMNNNTVLNNDPVLTIAVSTTNPDTLYIATAPNTKRTTLYKSTNGGSSFVNITGTLPDRYCMDIAVDPTNSAIVYVVLSGFGTSHLYKSSNGGNLWFDIGSQLPDVPTTALAIDPQYPNLLYLGNDLGVYVSTDGGTSWKQWKEGLPDAAICMDLSISPKNRKIRVATHGNGVFERKMFDQPTEIEQEKSIAMDFKLEQNYPNPFSAKGNSAFGRNQSTTINYKIPKAEFVTLKVYDLLGKEVAVLVNEEKTKGQYAVKFEALNLSSGIYYYELKAGDLRSVKKMILIK